MNYQSSQNHQILSGLIAHQANFVDPIILLKVAQKTSLKIWLHDSQAVQEKKSIIYHIVLEKHAKLTFLLGIVYAKNIDIEIHLHLQGDGAQAELAGVYGLNGEQQFSIKTYQIHEGVNTKSSVVLKGMLKGQARANVQGLIFIGQKACKSDASQENKNIVMGTHARVVSIPSIEVLQHDVQCCHGAAVGQFDDKHRWYLQSRGLDFDQVYKLLIRSFFGNVVQKFENEVHVMEMLCKKMV